MNREKKRKFKIVVITVSLIIILLTYLQIPKRFHHEYVIISKDDLLNNLHEELAENFTSGAVSDCDYYDHVRDETILSPDLVHEDLPEGHRIRDGGEYAPSDCKPKYSTAVVVPYRDKPLQLRNFLIYIHLFLRRQHIHYRIFVIEQVDSLPYNEGKLVNIGAKAAMKAGYPCLVFHDIEYLPLQTANLYACTKVPRHMSRFPHINSYPMYNIIDGGVVGLTSKHFKLVNGMSNDYSGLGGEDEDFYHRLNLKGLKMCSIDDISMYAIKMADSPPMKGYNWSEKKSVERITTKHSIANDGLNSLHYTEVATVLHPLFTHIMVDL